MIRQSFPIFLCCLVAVSCDKAKDFANKAKNAMENQISENPASGGGATADPELQKLVDESPEGVIFRKDIPFPANLEVLATLREEIDTRIHQTSAIEARVIELKGTRLTVTKLERAADNVRYTLEQSSLTAPNTEDADAPPKAIVDPRAGTAPSNKPIVFRKSEGAWKASGTDGFRAAVLSREIAPVFNQLLEENALAPRSLWFGKRRFKPGDQIKVTGETLPMILTGKVSGSLVMTYEGADAVEGHPCGVFSVTGDFSRKKFPDFEGGLTDEDVTIESGKIWLSLLHPIILKHEFNMIQTIKSGGQGGSSERSQGKVKQTLTRAWKAG